MWLGRFVVGKAIGQERLVIGQIADDRMLVEEREVWLWTGRGEQIFEFP